MKTLLSPLLAALIWASVVFREMVASSSLDPLAMVLSLLALALTLRVGLLANAMKRRLQLWSNAPKSSLVLAPEGLVYRRPGHDLCIAKKDLIAVVERGHWQTHRTSGRWSDVYLIHRTVDSVTYSPVPPIFEGSPGRLAQRLMQWQGPAEIPEQSPFPAPHQLASAVYDEIAAGRGPAGSVGLSHGRGWMARGPYLSALLGVIVIESFLRAPDVWQAIDPTIGAGIVLVFLAIPARWLWMTARQVRPRKGLSLAFTPSELLMRNGRGMLRMRWDSLSQATVDYKRRYSVLNGAHQASELVLSRTDGTPIRYDEAFLGAPVEVVREFVDAYRSRRLP